MSDWEDDMYDDDDEEELSFEEDDDEVESADIDPNKHDNDKPDLESWYFQAKELKEDESYSEALDLLNKIIEYKNILEFQDNEYIFKAIKQSIKIASAISDYKKIIRLLDTLFTHIYRVDKSYCNSSLSKILIKFDRNDFPIDFQKQFYEKFSVYLNDLDETQKNENTQKKLYIKVNLGISNVFILEKQYAKASKILSDLENLVLESNESVKNTYLLDVLASEMSIISEFNFNLPELARLTKLANNSITGIPQSRIVGTINECSGLVAMYSHDYKLANSFFQDAFRCFNECGDVKRVDILTKFMISNLLSESEVNPFESSDFQGLLKIESIENLMKLYNDVQSINIENYNYILKQSNFKELISKNDFLKTFIPYISDLIRMKYISYNVPLFKKLTFSRLTAKLEINDDELESLLLKQYYAGTLSNIKLDLIDKYIEKPEENIRDIIDPNFDSLDLLDRILKWKVSNDSISIVSEDLLNIEDSNSSNSLNKKFKVLENYESYKNSIDNISDDDNENMDIDIDNSIPVKSYMKSALGNKNTQRVNSPAFNNDTMLFISGNFLTRTVSTDVPGALPNFQHDISIPFTCLNGSILKDLFACSLGDDEKEGEKRVEISHGENDNNNEIINESHDKKKRFSSKTELVSILKDYIVYMNSSVPKRKAKEMTHLEKIQNDQMEIEFKKLYGEQLNEANIRSAFKKDANIVEVIQTTIMNNLEPPPNPNEKELEILDPMAKRYKKLGYIKQAYESVKELNDKLHLDFDQGLKIDNGNKIVFQNHLHARGNDLYRTTMINRGQMLSLGAEKSETTSLDGMSIGDMDDDIDEDEEESN